MEAAMHKEYHNRKAELVAEAKELLGGEFVTRPQRFVEAYLAMVEHADYRPAAPGDGMGHVCLTTEELLDPERLAREAVKYSKQFDAEENTRRFNLGCSNFSTNRALVFTIEAARALCGGADDLAVELLQMALQEVRTHSKMLNKKRRAASVKQTAKRDDMAYDPATGDIYVGELMEKRAEEGYQPTAYIAPEQLDKICAWGALATMGLKVSPLIVAMVLVYHANPYTGRCDPGLHRIASLTGLNLRTVRRALRELESSGILKTGFRFRSTSAYHVNWKLLRKICERAYLTGRASTALAVRNTQNQEDKTVRNTKWPNLRSGSRVKKN
jgi:hypothetical protein